MSGQQQKPNYEAYQQMVEQQTQAMLDVVAAVSVGDFDVPIDIPEGIGVLSELAVGLTFMVDELRDLQAKQDLYQSAIEERLDDLRRVNQELDQFAYIVSHDLKAPLRNIAALVDMLDEELEEQLTEDTREYMGLLKQRTGWMHDMIEGVLSYARAGYTSQPAEDIDVVYMVTEIVRMLTPAAGMQVEISESLPRVHTDPVKLGQVFSSLIDNAFKYHHQETGVVTITGEETEAGYKFVVKDDGPGIAAQHHEKIFELFGRLQSRDVLGSSGVGLTTAKKIIEGRGGQIGIESALGEGSVFWFTWPM